MNASTDTSAFCARHVKRRRDSAAGSFDDADFVHGVTRDGLLTRMRPMTAEASVVVDLGAATGSAVPALQKRFRRARVIAVDSSAGMLRVARSKRRFMSKPREVQADAWALPFADASVDVIFSNLMLPWLDQPEAVFTEVARVLREDGLFAFSTLGPDSRCNGRATANGTSDPTGPSRRASSLYRSVRRSTLASTMIERRTIAASAFSSAEVTEST